MHVVFFTLRETLYLAEAYVILLWEALFMGERAPFFSAIEPIQDLLAQRAGALGREGIGLSLKQEIPYGTQINLEGSGGTGLINVYFSKKKGLSFVDCSRNAVSARALAVLRGIDGPPAAAESGTPENELRAWIGTDESGKGDFFGPLVVAGFYTTRRTATELMELGVCDSKTLSRGQIRSLAGELRKRYPHSIALVAPSVRKYNELYGKFRNLNRLLAWAHARAIQNLIEGAGGAEGHAVDGVVADQFGDPAYITKALKSMAALNLIQRPRAESNPAVAAASILARDLFERKIADIHRRFGVSIPLGAGEKVTAAARAFLRAHGRDALVDAAKIHFKTYRELGHG
ncbi:MAG: ribonuclease HIII [Chitinivibrionales bacterium]|nr:ribonuclease HIII [Chitinivibrionales bacterium]MBD3396951.1 ribonuclease HIII [Chitinivibrionales bacterium]